MFFEIIMDEPDTKPVETGLTDAISVIASRH